MVRDTHLQLLFKTKIGAKKMKDFIGGPARRRFYVAYIVTIWGFCVYEVARAWGWVI